VEIRFVDTPAAKMCFEYIIRRKADNEIAVIGSTVQVFLDSAGQLALSVPRFFEDWKKRWLK
jgi:acyl-CoA thioester hydrolase